MADKPILLEFRFTKVYEDRKPEAGSCQVIYRLCPMGITEFSSRLHF